jgi:error-prone DNA polymerase
VTAPYAELHAHTNYSLLEGASHPGELVGQARALGYDTLAVTDRDNLYGAIEFARTCHEYGIRPIIGVELTVGEHPDAERRGSLILLASSRQGYANLCRLISLASGHGEEAQSDRERRRRDPCLARRHLAAHAEGVLCLTGGRSGEVASAAAAGDLAGAETALRRLVRWFGTDDVLVELHDNLVEGDRARNRALVALARRVGVGVVATGDVHYHHPDRHRLHDALTAIRHRTSLEASHRLRRPNGQFFLRPPGEQARRFAEWPEAVAATVEVAARCTFDLTADLGYRLPAPPVPAGRTADSHLAARCREALDRKYGPDERPRARRRLDEELAVIAHHGLAGFFLVYAEVFELATEVAAEVRGGGGRGRADLPAGRGRGSSVGSLVCYLIGLSHIDPVRNELFFGRFLNETTTALPDIDLDFPRDVRDRLFQRVYERWGTDRAALVAIFPRYRIRSAIRDLGKALGLPLAELDRLAKLSEGYGSARAVREEMLRAPQFRGLVDAPGWRELIELAGELADFPRHLSQHVGGVVIASEPLVDCVPISPAAWPGRYICHWDKDSIDDARMVKIDFLALGMLSLVEECLDRCAERGESIDLSRIDFDDTAVYDRIGRGDTVGVFQIESRAQAGMLPRTRPRSLDDLTAQVAIIRPGPIVGGAVHAFVEARQRAEQAGGGAEVVAIHPCVEPVLRETYGVVLYQEQVTQVAMHMGGLSAGEAETFRRIMSRRNGAVLVEHYRERFLDGAAERRVPRAHAEAMFEALLGFAQFGFPKSHATAFALLAYQTAWLKEHHPAEFYCALYNNWPMGFYPPHVITGDARRHGIEVRRPDIDASDTRCTVEGRAVRLGLDQVKGVGRATGDAIVAERDERGPYRSLWDLVHRTGLGRQAAENAVRVGVLDRFGLGRHELLWQLGLFHLDAHQPRRAGPRQLRLELPTEQDEVSLADLSPYERMADDYELLSLSPDAHPMSFLRPELGPRLRTSTELASAPGGIMVETAGLVVCRQRPGTSNGAVFLLLEDEHGVVNVMLGPQLYERHRVAVRTSPFLRVRGVVDDHPGEVAMLRARSVGAIEPSALRLPDGKSWG